MPLNPLKGSKRHLWKDDVCKRCGLHRKGYSGGRTGQMLYFVPSASTRLFWNRAGNCVPREGGS